MYVLKYICIIYVLTDFIINFWESDVVHMLRRCSTKITTKESFSKLPSRAMAMKSDRLYQMAFSQLGNNNNNNGDNVCRIYLI